MFDDLSSGSFDVTLGPVLKIWHQAREEGLALNTEGKPGPLPDPNALKEAKAHCGNGFLIIDKSTLIHVGASLNHLGKKCFAFSSLDKSNIPDILAKL